MNALYGFLLAFGPSVIVMTIFLISSKKIKLPKIAFKRKPKEPELSPIEDMYNWKRARRLEEHKLWMGRVGELGHPLELEAPKRPEPEKVPVERRTATERMDRGGNTGKTITGTSLRTGKRMTAPQSRVLNKFRTVDGEIWYELNDGETLVVVAPRVDW